MADITLWYRVCIWDFSQIMVFHSALFSLSRVIIFPFRFYFLVLHPPPTLVLRQNARGRFISSASRARVEDGGSLRLVFRLIWGPNDEEAKQRAPGYRKFCTNETFSADSSLENGQASGNSKVHSNRWHIALITNLLRASCNWKKKFLKGCFLRRSSGDAVFFFTFLEIYVA